MHIDRSLLNIDIAPPHMIKDLPAGVSPIGICHEEKQKFEFSRAYINSCCLQQKPDGYAYLKANLRTAADPFARIPATSTQQCLDTRYQLFGGDGLGHIVICTDLQPLNNIGLSGFRCEHDHRQLLCNTVSAQTAKKFHAAAFRQHPIEY